MKLKNTSTRNYIYENIVLEKDKTLEVSDEKACQTFLKQEGVEEVFGKEQVDKMKAEIEKLKAEKVATKPKAKKK